MAGWILHAAILFEVPPKAYVDMPCLKTCRNTFNRENRESAFFLSITAGPAGKPGPMFVCETFVPMDEIAMIKCTVLCCILSRASLI